MENKKSKLVFDMRVARKLIHEGCNVIDIKPLKSDPNRTVIVFEDTEDFQRFFRDIVEDIKEKDELRKNQIIQERPQFED